MNPFPTSNLLLKQQPKLFEQILDKKIKPAHVLELFGLSIVGLALFGGVMSIILPNWWHAFNLMWKMLVLIFGSYALCLPALYVFSSIRGSRLTLSQLVLFLLASIATTAIVLLALSPIAWFFTWSTNNNLDIIRAMNTVMIGFGIIFGIILLARSFQAGYKHYKEQDPNSKSGADILLLWLILVIVVTVQMGQKLGPWYHAEGTICSSFDLCFPREAEGTLIQQPTIQPSESSSNITTVTWTTSCPNALHDVYYMIDQQVHMTGANCTLGDGQNQCRAELEQFTAAASGTTVQVQTREACGPDQTVISPVVSYTKP